MSFLRREAVLTTRIGDDSAPSCTDDDWSGRGVTSKLRMSLPIPVESFQGSHHLLVGEGFDGFFGDGFGTGFGKGDGARVSSKVESSGIVGICLVTCRVWTGEFTLVG